MDDNLIRAICDATERVVADIEPAHHELPTPCSEWSVRDLANHLLATLELGRALLSDEMPGVQAGPGQLPTADLLGDDLVGAYRTGAKALVAATTPAAVGRVHTTPLGEMPGTGLAGFAALDVLVHGWDLARAIGREATIDPTLAEPMLEFARQAIGDEMGTRSPRIGPEVTVAADADLTSRLVAYLGRTP
jgi:uncharacterized protein (TIGR03086 family)